MVLHPHVSGWDRELASELAVGVTDLTPDWLTLPFRAIQLSAAAFVIVNAECCPSALVQVAPVLFGGTPISESD